MISIARIPGLSAALMTLLAAGIAGASVKLQWTAPGDDARLGQASRYDLRYSITPITAANFAQATPCSGLPAPSPAGTQETFMLPELVPASTYYAALRTEDEAGNWSGVSNVIAFTTPAAGVDSSVFELTFSAPWPNPARQLTRCAFTLGSAAPIQVDAFDVFGRHVRTLASGPRAPGPGEVVWNLCDDQGRPVATGVYLIRAHLAGRTWTQRVAVVR
jgi:hypothetical protein